MEPNDLPIVCSPLELPAEAAAELLEFLSHLTETIERHYFGELHRLAHRRPEPNPGPGASPFNRPKPHPPVRPHPSLKIATAPAPHLHQPSERAVPTIARI